MDRGYSNGVNREEPETTTLLPFCDELFIYSNDDNERVNSVVYQLWDQWKRDETTKITYFIIRFYLLLFDQIMCLQRLAYNIVLKKENDVLSFSYFFKIYETRIKLWIYAFMYHLYHSHCHSLSLPFSFLFFVFSLHTSILIRKRDGSMISRDSPKTRKKRNKREIR